MAWRTINATMWRGQTAYLEFLDSPIPNLSGPPLPKDIETRPTEGYIQISDLRLADQPAPPEPVSAISLAVLSDPAVIDMASLCVAYGRLLAQAVARTGALAPDREGLQILDWLLRNDLLNQTANPFDPKLGQLCAERRTVEASLPAPRRVLAMTDGDGQDERVFVRGSHKAPGETAPRLQLAFLPGRETSTTIRGSGRLELAKRLVDPRNPLTARVLVNRVWQHHFGIGLVSTPDDFGSMGQPPTHPELLDWLAANFVERDGWSLKALHRRIVLSRAYGMAGQSDPGIEQRDPQNRLLHRMPVRRLEAEAIRDSILAVSGRLDRKLFGPSVAPYLTSFMEGRGRPEKSGPLDGDGRRTLYLNVRRNFLPPLLLAFDFPIPFSTMGRRSVSNVPAQALALMNGPFVLQEARRWAEKALREPNRSPEERIRRIYLEAFARPPATEELQDARAFLKEQARRYETTEQDKQVWADLCHVLFNLKEFIYIP
jgi:hypothetical protein